MEPHKMTPAQRLEFYQGKVAANGSTFLRYEKRPNRGTPLVHFICTCGKEASITTPSLLKKSALCYQCSHAGNRVTQETIQALLDTESATLVRQYLGEDQRTKVVFKCKCGTEVDFSWNWINSAASKRKGIKPKCKVCSRREKNLRYGPDHPNWNPSLSEEERAIRVNRYRDADFRMWAEAIKARDNYTCAISGIRGVELAAHHIHPWGTHKELRYSVSNGISLDRDIHREFHWDFMGGTAVPSGPEDLVRFAMERYGVGLVLPT